MKRILSILCIVGILTTNLTNVFAKEETTINGVPIISYEYNNQKIISIRDLENFGFEIEWSQTENRAYLTKTNNNIRESSLNKENLDFSKIAYMNPTATPKGNIETFNILGRGFMYFKDLSKFGIVNFENNSAILDERTIFENNNPEINEETIKGYTTVSLETAKNWARKHNANQRFIDIADLYWKYAAITGIRAEVMYAQAAFETGFGTYQGNVIPEQNNWAGIKTKNATGDTTYDHESFATPEDGVRAHYNHMIAYVGGEPIGTPHERYYTVKDLDWAGTVNFITDLSGKWCPRADYANTILRFLSELYQEG